MSDGETFIHHLYDRFVAREIEAVLAMLDPNAVRANGWEGGHAMGAMIDPMSSPSA